MRKLALLALCFVFSLSLINIFSLVNAQEVEDLVVADFERWPNNLGGEMGVYGSLEPDWFKKKTVPYSWIYDRKAAGYSKENVHGGKQSFRLVNSLGINQDVGWGSFGIDLGPVTDLTTEPVTVDAKDVSGYKYLTFWVKGEEGTENAEVIFRDGLTASYMPQAKYKVPIITTEWQKVVVPLTEVEDDVDLSQLVHIGIAFGEDVGNEKGAIIYLDDFVFTNNK